MEEISAAKKPTIIRLYLGSKSIREIASWTGVSAGTVASVPAALKKARLSRIREPFEQVQMARELRSQLKVHSMTLEHVAAGPPTDRSEGVNSE